MVPEPGEFVRMLSGWTEGAPVMRIFEAEEVGH